MEKNEDSGSPSWSASFFMQTTEDVARAVAAAAAAAAASTAPRSPRPSVVFSSKDENGNILLQKLQHQVTRVLKGFSHTPEVPNGTYNPEVLTSQKRQWANFQMQSLDHRPLKEPSRLFESFVVVGLHPNCDIQALQKQYFDRKSEGSGKFRSGHHQSRVESIVEPQVLFVYPPEKQLPLKHKDLVSFCFPGGLEVHTIEKTPSMSELNEILLGQEHLKQSDLSFVFRLQVADDSTLYGSCVLVEEMVQKPSGLISMISDRQPSRSGLSRHVLTTRRCYCILSRLPFFELHFGILKSGENEARIPRSREVSAQGLGCMGMSAFYGPPKPDEDMIKLIHHAIDSGVTFVDTSDVYGPHTNEILLGKVVSRDMEQESRTGSRNNFQISPRVSSQYSMSRFTN